MNVLVACEESQTVCTAFRERGHRAFSCDLQDCSGGRPEWHIKGDCLPLLDGNCTFQTADTHTHTQAGQWDLIVAHPPCTYLSNAGACRLYPHKGQIDEARLRKGIQAKDFFMEFWYARCDKICIENPMPSGVFCLPKPSQIIQPWQFGHPYTKKTYLWLKGLPPLMATVIEVERKPFLPSGTGRKLRGETYGVAQTAKERSKTFPGIARAMAEQWAGENK